VLRFRCLDPCTPKAVLVLIAGEILGVRDVKLVRFDAASTLKGKTLEWMYVNASACTSAEDVCVQFTAEVERSGKYLDVKIINVEFNYNL